ncbi:MAG TPA: transaldolase [bacterium]|nr:transaldolase [bacterium]
MTRLQQLLERGQSIWIDYIERDFITSGHLAGLIREGVRGLTSNPAIFQKAISEGAAYDADIAALAARGLAAEKIYEALAIADIRAAADAFRPLHLASDGADGYVSLEVNPDLAHDTQKTIEEAERLFAAVNRPNLMIKIPATTAGIDAISQVIAAGISVNATLLFNSRHYLAVAGAWLAGLENRLNQGQPLQGIASVASFFVSRLDTRLDPQLDRLGCPGLKGKLAVANAAAVYDLYQELLTAPRWRRLAASGARPQRLLWASTGTKDPHYSDTLYVDELIGPATVNTVPPATFKAWLDHGRTAATLPAAAFCTRTALRALAEHGINLDMETEALQKEGVAAFAKSFAAMLQSVADK